MLNRPAGWWVLTAPLDVLAEDTAVQPDIIVCGPGLPAGRHLEGPPLLVVEVVSPSTRLHDYNVKFARYERACIPSYWVVDPDELRLTAWELRDGRYVEVADLTDGDWTAAQPYPVTVRPSALLG